ncbi:hypothetical protein TCE0_018f05644, partial [Talaromyces pinophilus]
IAR